MLHCLPAFPTSKNISHCIFLPPNFVNMSNAGATSAIQHPLQATASAIAGAGADPRPNRTSLFQSANEGPAEIAAKISGVTLGGKREDDAPYYTNNESIPWPDPYVHSWHLGRLSLPISLTMV